MKNMDTLLDDQYDELAQEECEHNDVVHGFCLDCDDVIDFKEKHNEDEEKTV